MKKLLSIFAVVALATTANASYLYWTVADSYATENTGRTFTYDSERVGLDSENNFLYGRIHVVENGSDTAISSGIRSSDGSDVAADATTPGTYAIDISSYGTSASYYIEIIAYDESYNTSQVAYTGSLNYQQLVEKKVIYNSTDLSPIDPEIVANVWHGAGTNAPEPTSAMLMLLGVAGLALKRKQRKLA